MRAIIICHLSIYKIYCISNIVVSLFLEFDCPRQESMFSIPKKFNKRREMYLYNLCNVARCGDNVVILFLLQSFS